MAALAEPRRLGILRLVWDAERTAGDIAAATPVTFGAVSQHLKVLLDAGLVRVRKDGRRRWYRADHAALGPFAPALEAMWGLKLDHLKRPAEAEQAADDAAALRTARTARPPRPKTKPKSTAAKRSPKRGPR
jgi:DNA-binding transcriptional ArsR family regulator